MGASTALLFGVRHPRSCLPKQSIPRQMQERLESHPRQKSFRRYLTGLTLGLYYVGQFQWIRPLSVFHLVEALNLDCKKTVRCRH